MNKERFFASVRKDLFKGKLSQEQVDGMNNILDNIQDVNIQSQAYILATVYHETAQKMQPLSEYGKGRDYKYGKWKTNSKGVRYCFKNGSGKEVYTEQENSNLFYGRGLVQLTWYDNYKRATEKLHGLSVLPTNKSLLTEPELANVPYIAIWILKVGMQEGWFTGRKLDHYFLGSKIDYVNARRIINGMDKANAIAVYAEYFEKALRA